MRADCMHRLLPSAPAVAFTPSMLQLAGGLTPAPPPCFLEIHSMQRRHRSRTLQASAITANADDPPLNALFEQAVSTTPLMTPQKRASLVSQLIRGSGIGIAVVASSYVIVPLIFLGTLAMWLSAIAYVAKHMVMEGWRKIRGIDLTIAQQLEVAAEPSMTEKFATAECKWRCSPSWSCPRACTAARPLLTTYSSLTSLLSVPSLSPLL